MNNAVTLQVSLIITCWSHQFHIQSYNLDLAGCNYWKTYIYSSRHFSSLRHCVQIFLRQKFERQKQGGDKKPNNFVLVQSIREAVSVCVHLCVCVSLAPFVTEGMFLMFLSSDSWHTFHLSSCFLLKCSRVQDCSDTSINTSHSAIICCHCEIWIQVTCVCRLCSVEL